MEDGLASNFPHLSLLDSLEMNYVIGVKPGDHAFLFEWIRELKAQEHVCTTEDGARHAFRWYADVPLNDEHYDYRVNVLDYSETKKNGKRQHFTWVTKIGLHADNVYELMRAGRARWRIENETFNTLKNQGYHFQHNYGHGYEDLCSVMTMLMLLSFLIDQVQQLCCKVYQKARERRGPLYALFERVRALATLWEWESFEALYQFIGTLGERALPQEKGWLAYFG